MPLFCFVLLILFGACFLFYSIVCLYVNVWSVEYEPFEKYIAVEDFQDSKQFSELVEGKSLLHRRLSYYNMHFNYIIIYLSLFINMMGPII
jgi:hypothetical protein